MRTGIRIFRTALREYRTAEIAGNEHNPRILEYHATTVLRATDDETPWCASFVCWVLAQCGMEHTRSARARSFETWGNPVSTLDEAEFGDVVVLSRGANPALGHVGFYASHDAKRVQLLGGNQGNAVNFSQYDRSRIIAIRRATYQEEQKGRKMNIFQIIFNAPRLVESLGSIVNSAKTKNVATTVAAISALCALVAQIVGVDWAPDSLAMDTITAVAVFIIGFFTGRKTTDTDETSTGETV